MSRRTRWAIALTLVLTVQAPAAVAADPVDWTCGAVRPRRGARRPGRRRRRPVVADVAVDLAAAAVDTDHDRLSDAFETNVTRTSISSADSDRDGIRDGIEDPDNDGLSNAGEQSFGRISTTRIRTTTGPPTGARTRTATVSPTVFARMPDGYPGT